MAGKITPSNSDILDMWVVYRHPRDYPDNYVARRWVCNDGRSVPSQDDFVLADNLGELQAALIKAGRIVLMRSPSDDPVIVEVWL